MRRRGFGAQVEGLTLESSRRAGQSEAVQLKARGGRIEKFSVLPFCQ